MKKIIALIMSAALVFGLCACSSNPYSSDSEEDFSKKLESGEYGTLVGFYSVKNENRSDDEIWIQLSDAMQNTTLYSDDGTLVVKLMGGKNLFDENGEPVSEDDIAYGDTLIIKYNLKTYGEDPITVKAFRIDKMGV